MSAWTLYDGLMLEALNCDAEEAFVSNVVLGLSWTVVELQRTSTQKGLRHYGVCFSPSNVSRTLPWAGTLRGRSASELIPWIKSWNPAEAAVGCAVVNGLIGSQSTCFVQASEIVSDQPPHLQVFDYFYDRFPGQRVVVVGRYPGLEPHPEAAAWDTIERMPDAGDLPDTAAEYVLSEANWAFITGSSLANKTLPSLLRAAAHSKTVLMGPSVPWSGLWHQFGVDFVAGIAVKNPEKLLQVAMEGGGTRLFELACCYRLVGVTS